MKLEHKRKLIAFGELPEDKQVCQNCPAHLNKPSRCQLFGDYCGRKDRMCSTMRLMIEEVKADA